MRDDRLAAYVGEAQWGSLGAEVVLAREQEGGGGGGHGREASAHGWGLGCHVYHRRLDCPRSLGGVY